uniref:Uncharacterized protein n=1 Tax=viral metagenome TaxID=1070528 RepID=A0A6C0LAL0_9ZZZZ
MESPFAKHGQGSGSTFVLYLEPIMNPYFKSYQNVITLDRMPDGPLADMVTMVNLPKLSPFQEAGNGFGRGMGGSCIHVLLRYRKSSGLFSWKNSDIFMGTDDIPSVLGYLKANGYTIDTDLTKMMFKSRVEVGGISDKRFSGDRKVICFVSGGL